MSTSRAGEPAEAGQFIAVARVADVPPSTVRRVSLAGRGIALANIGGTFYAFEDRCLHWGIRLSQGRIEGGRLHCRLHDWTYDLARGVVESADDESAIGACIVTFPVRIEGEDVLVSPVPLRSAAPAEERPAR